MDEVACVDGNLDVTLPARLTVSMYVCSGSLSRETARYVIVLNKGSEWP